MAVWPLLYYASEWAIRLVMLVVVPRRRRPVSSTAWLLIIFFQPWAGLGLFLLLGGSRLRRRRIGRHARLLAKLRTVSRRFENHPHVVRPDLGPHPMGVVALAERLGHMPILGGNDMVLLSGTAEVIDRLIADIDTAGDHVHLLFYIYADDETGRRVADALARAAGRGVTCRVLVDAVGSRGMFRRLGPKMVEQGIEVKEALPVGLFRALMARIDLRNHRKLAIIDGRAAYTGSQNIINADYGHRDMAWHDLTTRLTGPAVLELQAVFIEDWYFETDEVLDGEGIFPPPRVTGPTPVQTLPSGPNYPTENYQRMVVDALHAAREHVIVTTPYFVPDEAFLQAVQTAVLRGVEVEIVVPRRTDHPLVDAASHAYYDDLFDAGARIHVYRQGMLHAKTMSIDDAIALIGSSNFDIRSFSLNFEINLLLYGRDVTCILRARQNRYIAGSVELTPQEWARRPKIRKVLQNIAKLLSPVL